MDEINDGQRDPVCTPSTTISRKQDIQTRFLQQVRRNKIPQEVCSSGEGCLVRFKGAGLELACVAGSASDNPLFRVYHRRFRIHRHSCGLSPTVEGFENFSQRPMSIVVHFPPSPRPILYTPPSSHQLLAPAVTDGGECCLDLAESVLERSESPFDRIESTR